MTSLNNLVQRRTQNFEQIMNFQGNESELEQQTENIEHTSTIFNNIKQNGGK